MALKFHPKLGTVLICDFSRGFKSPEMVKKRPVIVISPKLKRRTNLLTVVPLSTMPPSPVQEYHCELAFVPPLPGPFDSASMWVKADMLYTVSFDRLHLIATGRDQHGRRKYLTRKISDADMEAVRKCVLNGIGLSILTKHL